MDFNFIWITVQNSYGGENYNSVLDMGTAQHFDIGYDITSKMGFQTGIVATKMGQKYDNSHHNGLTKEVALNYIGIPVQYKFISGSPTTRFYLLVGPQFMFLQKATLSGSYTDVYGVPLAGDIASPKNRFEQMDIGIAWSLGTDILIVKSLYLNAGISFYYGLKDVNARSGTGAGSFHNNTWRWPDLQGTGVYDPSHIASTGLTLGLHYYFSHKAL